MLKTKKLKSRNLFYITILCIVSFAVYFNTLFNGFVFDDLFLIKENKWITDIRYLAEIFSSSSWSFLPNKASGTYRPMIHILYMPIYFFSGHNPLGYHLANIIFHTVNTILVFCVAHYLIAGHFQMMNPEKSATGDSESSIALFIALIFAVHPIHTEVVAWTSAAVELVTTILLLLSFLFYAKTIEGDVSILCKNYLFSLITFSVALFFKEISLTFPGILMAYDLYRGKLNSSRRAWRYIPFIISGLIYLGLRHLVIGGLVPGKEIMYELTPFQNIINVFPLLSTYFLKLFIPINLKAFYGFEPVYTLWGIKPLVSILFFIFFVFILLLGLFKDRFVLFLLFWTVIPLIPVLYIPALGRSPFAERYLYLPSIGFIILLVYLIANLIRGLEWSKKNTLVLISLISVLAIFSVGTIQRNTVWKNEFTLWSDTVKKSPNSYLALHKLGKIYLFNKKFEKAVDILSRAIEVEESLMPKDPDLVNAHFDLGLAYHKMGKTKEALFEYKETLKINPSHTYAHYRIGEIYTSLGLVDDAIKEHEKALMSKPDFKKAFDALKILYGLRSKSR